MLSSFTYMQVYYPSVSQNTISLHTNNTLGKRLVLECGKSEVSNLNRPCSTSDEDVVTFEITVNHRRRPAVKEQQTFEDLTTPVLENVQVDLLEPSYIPAKQSCINSTQRLVSNKVSNHITHGNVTSPLDSVQHQPVNNFQLSSNNTNSPQLKKKAQKLQCKS